MLYAGVCSNEVAHVKSRLRARQPTLEDYELAMSSDDLPTTLAYGNVFLLYGHDTSHRYLTERFQTLSLVVPQEVRFVASLVPQVLNCCISSALVFFEYFITLRQEVDNVWRRKLSAASLLFILNRYAILGTAILSVYGTWNSAHEASNHRSILSSLLLISS